MHLDFESVVVKLQDQIEALKSISGDQVKIQTEILRLEEKRKKLLSNLYKNLTAWQKVLVARHEQRPKTSAYIQHLIKDFFPLCGDKTFGDDFAIQAGLGHFCGRTVLVLGHEKGHDTESRLKHNFGMPHPEGYRKVLRCMDFAQRFQFPILTFIDTAGAYVGTQAEERGQAYAIAACLEKSFLLDVPIISVIIGEGGSGGAIALATANRVFMLEHSVYSVISPEGCASILWRSRDKREEAAVAQKLTAQDLKTLKVIDDIIPEPLGGAHRDPEATIKAVEKQLSLTLQENFKNAKAERRIKFLEMGNKFVLTPHKNYSFSKELNTEKST
ncbi:acetyl-coenzyme A carboxylase carboxyl transferase subunit alpha [Holospora obtusa F1]|uniref:Acetyl-coenzyme A carboxylase carboxyl transferase subunit alpha n=1 Tax=Holospora obtusa F1 TaxID=1399147 RepID=W6TDG0_HOLOB|nr:acetyl-CoA carboxylase carboxyltransferase subunit alpha [Holospora obtusa]ETZ07058.1 acetyl-coenzyme A carboxylase carboxyl transferase subunit alpha [Holospora obtusa F1]